MVSSEEDGGGGGGNLIRKVLGLGYWVQGFRCFPWLAVSFFLKDGLNVDPSTLQILQNSANLPMVGKPLYGLISDSIYISGQHRVPYIAIGEEAFIRRKSGIDREVLRTYLRQIYNKASCQTETKLPLQIYQNDSNKKPCAEH